MSVSRIALFVGLATVLAAGSLHAQGAQPSTTGSRSGGDGRIEHYDTAGKYHVRSVTPKGHEAMMKEARPLAPGSMVYRSGGKLYVVEDKRLPSGKMMSEQDEWFSQAEGNIE
jgi:hypothetical protein